ncbi:MAG: hypothetical protein RLZZ241_2526 [Bacteroidota bacterium]|jgi:membrane-bound lytic murein transglycosylase D
MKKVLLVAAFVGMAHIQAQVSPSKSDSNPRPASAIEGASTPLNTKESDSEGADELKLSDRAFSKRYDSLWLREWEATVNRFPEMYEQVQFAGVEDSTRLASEGFNTDSLKLRLERLDEKTPFTIAYTPALERVIKSFLLQKRDLMERMLIASQYYFPMFEETLDKYNLPLEIKYLAIVESALNPRAKSRVGATGLWQFMYSTGRMYGLNVSSYVDDRNDPVKATEAACKYLSRLYEIFGDWDLVLAAYNSGPGNVNKAIRRSGGYRNYWNIRPYLPRETAGYVPAFQAAMFILEYADAYGLDRKTSDWHLFETDTVVVSGTLTFKQISEYTGVPIAEIQYLNPAYKLDIIPKITGREHTLRLPVAALGVFVNNEEALYAQAEAENDKQEAPLPQLVETSAQITYRVRSGDYLGRIAERYGVSVSQIKRWNGLTSNNLRIGQRLLLQPGKPVASASVNSAAQGTSKGAGSNPKEHVVREGDSLWTISKKYPGVTIEDIKKWNGMRSDNIQPGTRLKLCNCTP